MSLITLSRLLMEGRADDHPVAFRHDVLINFQRFRADVMAAAVQFAGVDRAALICRDSYNFTIGFFGLLHAGATLVLPQNAHPGALQDMRNEYDILVDDAVVEKIPAATSKLNAIDANRLALVFRTSGSTGAPKKIAKNLAMLEREIVTLDSLWGQDVGTGPVFDTVSHQHVYGLTFKLLWPLMAGRPFAGVTHTLWESLLAEVPPGSVIVSSPAHLERMEGITPLATTQRPRCVFSAGAPLSLAASDQAEFVFGCRPTEIFGSTETGAFATRRQTVADEPWRLLPGMSMRCDQDGCLVLQSPFVGPEWLTTADRIEPVPDGFRFLGRADRVAKIEGKRIALAAVEQCLARMPLVKAAAVVVLPGKPIRLVAAIVPSQEGQVLLDEMGNFRFGRLLRQELALTSEPAGIPRLWRFVGELPAHGLGKRRDADITALFGGKQ